MHLDTVGSFICILFKIFRQDLLNYCITFYYMVISSVNISLEKKRSWITCVSRSRHMQAGLKACRRTDLEQLYSTYLPVSCAWYPRKGNCLWINSSLSLAALSLATKVSVVITIYFLSLINLLWAYQSIVFYNGLTVTIELLCVTWMRSSFNWLYHTLIFMYITWKLSQNILYLEYIYIYIMYIWNIYNR